MARIKVKNWIYLFSIVAVFSVYSCAYFEGNEYSRLVKKELAKGTRNDSLFMGIYLGMSSKDFYSHCWDMNKKGLFTNGTMNNTVMYSMGNDLKYPAIMNFYPAFYKDRIYTMQVSYEYKAWAPWNKAQYSDSLLPDVLNLYKKWYATGNDFIEMNSKDRRTVYVKIDGNRRITVGRYDDKLVKVDYTDLIVEEKLKEAQPKK